MTVPSVSLADVTLYGSFRAAVEFTSGGGAGDASVRNVGSRFGLTGSSEVSEGLTASFKLENNFDTATATIGGGRIGMVGLSGGFGSLSLGKMDTATARHFAFALDPTITNGVGGGSNYDKYPRMISYSSSVGAVGFQIDRHSDANGTATVEFGASAAAGPVNVGVAHWSKEKYDGMMVPVCKDVVGQDSMGGDVCSIDSDGDKLYLDPDGNDTVVAADAEMETEGAAKKMSFTGFVVSAGLAGMNLAVGVGSTDSGEDDDKMTTKIDESQTDVTIVALSGSIADSGVSYGIQMSDSDMTEGDDGKISDPSQTVINITSVLGGGASMFFNHLEPKEGNSKSMIGLKVDF